MPHSNTNLARRVVCNAHKYQKIPNVIANSWAQLKQAQGQPITPDRMARLQRLHIIEDPADTGNTPPPTPPINPIAADHSERAPRISQRIASYLAQSKSA